MKNPALITAAVLSIALTSGCVTGRRSFAVDVPPAESYARNPSKGSIVVGPITDARQFENKPDSPSTPSINGDVTLLSDHARNTFIGRQRNSWGHAEGDIVLPEGQTVQVKVAELLREGLKRKGYDITEAAPTVVTAEIQRFWTWVTPGFFALSFEAQLTCKVTLTSGPRQSSFIVKGYGLNHGQFAKDANWREAYDIAIKDFLASLGQQLDAAGF